jgi:hypothetical protein
MLPCRFLGFPPPTLLGVGRSLVNSSLAVYWVATLHNPLAVFLKLSTGAQKGGVSYTLRTPLPGASAPGPLGSRQCFLCLLCSS